MRIPLRKIGSCATVALCATALAIPAWAVDEKDSQDQLHGSGLTGVVPAVRQLTESQGKPWMLSSETKIVAPQELADDARQLALDLAIKGNIHPEVAVGSESLADEGDVILSVDPQLAGVPKDEGYRLKISDKQVKIIGKSAQGAFWGTRTLVQSVANSRGAQAGEVTDWPDVSERSFHLDAARKFYDIHFFRELIREMSYHKLNTLQYHFSENEGFRLEPADARFKNLLSEDGYITREQLKEILAEAHKYHIEVVPALDMPGHLRHILDKHPEFRLPTTNGSGAQNPNSEMRRGLDFTNPEAVAFMKDLVADYAKAFPGTKWHLGSDEFVDFPKAAMHYPDMMKRIKDNAKLGEGKNFADGFVYFINDMAAYMKTLGKTDIRVWNDAFYRNDLKQNIELDKNITIDYWTAWDRHMADVKDFVDKGYRLINYNDAYMYYVLYYPGRAYSTRVPADKIHNEFHAGRFPTNHHKTQSSWPQDAPKKASNTQYPDWLTGASFAVWSDNAKLETQEEVLKNSKMPYVAFANRVWYAGDSRDYAQFAAAEQKIAPAPAVPSNLKVGVKTHLASQTDVQKAVKKGDKVTFTGKVTNTSSEKVPVNVTLNAKESFGTINPDNVTTKILDKDGHPIVLPGKNVALASAGAKATASSTEAAQFGPEKTIDGKISAESRWASQYKDGEWLNVTLAKATDITKVRLGWEGAYATDYTVEISHQNGKTTTYKRQNFDGKGAGKNTAAWDDITLSTTEGKDVTAIKIIADKRKTEWGASLFEVEALTAERQAAPSAPILTPDGDLVWQENLEPGSSLELTWAGIATHNSSSANPLKAQLRGQAHYGAIATAEDTSDITYTVGNDEPAPEPKPEPAPKPVPQPDPTNTKVIKNPAMKTGGLAHTGASVLGLVGLAIAAGIGGTLLTRRKK